MREMKDSDIEWIGQIPDSWEIARVKDAFVRKNKKANQLNPTVLSLARTGIKVRDISNNEGQLAADYSNYNPVDVDDLLLNPMDLISGDNCNISKVKGVISPAYVNLRFKKNISPEFYNFYFKYQYWSKAFFAHGKGVSFENRWTLNNDTLKGFPIVIPPYEEQKRIANFLNEKCNEINSLTDYIQSQITTLEECKKSIISETVTKGLNPNVDMKNSGIEGVKEIPSHWQVKRAKYICKSLFKGNGITKDDIKNDGDICCIRYGEIYSKYNGAVTAPTTSTNVSLVSSPKHIKKGDLLFAGTGELIEEIGKNIVYIGNAPCLAGGDIIIMRHSQNPIFLNYTMNSVLTQIQKSKGKAKLKVVHISATDIGNLFVAIPTLEEQQQIADYLDSKCSEIDAIIQTKKEQLEVLAEYKKSLIYEYVTGKKEVK